VPENAIVFRNGCIPAQRHRIGSGTGDGQSRRCDLFGTRRLSRRPLHLDAAADGGDLHHLAALRIDHDLHRAATEGGGQRGADRQGGGGRTGDAVAVIASEAKALPASNVLFDFQTADTPSPSRCTKCPRFACISRPPESQRAQGMPDARCTRGLVCNVHKECAHEHTGQRRTSDIPCAMALRLITCSPRRTALLPPLLTELLPPT
jgi:hypothetical protein